MISYIGLSHLSLSYAASALVLGNKVLILDFDEQIKLYKKKKLNFFEPGLEKILIKFKQNLEISSDFKKLKLSKIIFLAKDIKTDDNNNVLLNETNSLLRKINYLRNKKILVIMNQVPVGFTRKIKWKKDNLYHFVETLVFGNSINRAINPERIIIGKITDKKKISRILLNFLKLYKCNIIELNYEESELSKNFINIYLASQLMTTNFLSEISNFYNARWNKIMDAIKLDKRIGKNGYYKPGLGISGGNIERDIQTLKKISVKKNIHNKLPEFLINSNSYYKNWIKRIILKEKKNKNNIGILGLTYKDNTLSIKNAPQIKLIKSFKKNINLHDTKSERLANLSDTKKFLDKFKDLNFILNNSETIIVFHNLLIYKKIKFYKYKNIKYVIDPFGFINKKKIGKIKYYNLSS